MDRYLESARLQEQEALAYRQRADRLQLVTEKDVAGNLGGAPPPPPPADAGSRAP